MKIKLIIASDDLGYTEHLSRVLADQYAEVFEVGVCTTTERLSEQLIAGRYDVVLLEPAFAAFVNLDAVRLALLLYDASSTGAQEDLGMKCLKKYQRISSMAGTIMEHYAQLSANISRPGATRAKVVAVWSPAGGTGKTTVALAYAARKVANGAHVTYLSFEHFSSVSAFFPPGGKSISTVFEKLESDVPMLLMGIRQQDRSSGITYFCGPDNYDDMNILTVEDRNALILSCAVNTDEVVIDLPSQCDERTREVFDLANTVLLVCDASAVTQAKMRQFMSQHNISQRIQDKCVLVNNKGAAFAQENIDKTVLLPMVQSADAASVYKTLSGNPFEW